MVVNIAQTQVVPEGEAFGIGIVVPDRYEFMERTKAAEKRTRYKLLPRIHFLVGQADLAAGLAVLDRLMKSPKGEERLRHDIATSYEGHEDRKYLHLRYA